MKIFLAKLVILCYSVYKLLNQEAIMVMANFAAQFYFSYYYFFISKK